MNRNQDRWEVPYQVYLWGTLMLIFVALVYGSGWLIIQDQNDRIERNTRALVCLNLAHQQVVVEAIDVTHGRFPSLVPICGANADELVQQAEEFGIENLPPIELGRE